MILYFNELDARCESLLSCYLGNQHNRCGFDRCSCVAGPLESTTAWGRQDFAASFVRLALGCIRACLKHSS